MSDTCVCGDAADEHERTRSGLGACVVEDCACFHYEADGDDDEAGDA